MQKKLFAAVCITALLTTSIAVHAQTPVDGFYPGKGNGAVALSYSHEKYDQFFLGNGSIANWAGDYNVNSVSLYATYGITDKFAAAVSVPYIMIKTVNFSDETVKRKSLQDLGVYLKYRALEKDFGSWNLSLSPAIGFTTPITDYATDFYAVGQDATGLDIRGIAMVTTDMGVFGEVQGAGLLRFNPTPSGASFNVKAGYYNAKIYGDVYYSIQQINGGVGLPDPEDFRELAVSYQKVGVTVAYNILSSLGVYAGGAYVIDGKSVGQSTRITGGAVVRF